MEITRLSAFKTKFSSNSAVIGIKRASNRFFENDLPYADNRFRKLTTAKLVSGIGFTYLGMSIGSGFSWSSLIFTGLWTGITAARNIYVDLRASDSLPKFGLEHFGLDQSIHNIRGRKLANDLLTSGLSSILLVLAKACISDKAAHKWKTGVLGHIAMDIGIVSAVGGPINYVQRTVRHWPKKVVHKDMWRSLIMSASAYSIFAVLYAFNITHSLVPSAVVFALVRKPIGELWAAYSEYPAARRTFLEEQGKRSTLI